VPATDLPRRGIPDATVARLPAYLRVLGIMAEAGVRSTSSLELAQAVGVHPAKVRKDLSHLGSHGVRGVGYDVAHLTVEISRELGLTRDWPVVIVGLGNLGRALAGHAGLSSRGFSVAGLFDADPAVIGQSVSGLTISPMSAIADLPRAADTVGVIATPAAAAQVVADQLVAAGITSILNCAPAAIVVPAPVDVRRVDIASELQILAFHKQRRTAAPALAVAP